MTPHQLRSRLDRVRNQFGFGEELRQDDIHQVLAQFPELPPMAESLLIVNPDGSPTDAHLLADRRLCHLFGWRHRCPQIFLLTQDATKLIIQIRSEDKDEAPGKLDLTVGGHVKGGHGDPEEFRTAAVEEMSEELGLRESDIEGGALISIGQSVATYNIETHDNPLFDIHNAEVRRIYHGVLAHGAFDRVHFADGEIAALQLVGLAEAWSLLERDDIASGLRFCLPIYLAWLQGHVR